MDDPSKYLFIETWASQAHLEAHMTTDHVKAFIGAVMAIMGQDDIVIKKYKSCGY